MSLTLEGCRGSTASFPALGPFVCPDGQYTTGNLGKMWNELDLVPHRLVSDAGNSAPTMQQYAVAVAADRMKGSEPGYDYISEPTPNAALSTPGAGCAVSASTLGSESPGQGGVDTTIYRTLAITQRANSTCVFDYYQRLALDSHLFPGSALHSNLLNQNLGTAGIGSKEVSIPVKEIKPQTIDKDVTATHGQTNVWSVRKSTADGPVDFGNTCDPDASLSQSVHITVAWTKTTTSSTGVTITTQLEATNPASRPIDISISDVVTYTGGSYTFTKPASGYLEVPAHSTDYPVGTPDTRTVATTGNSIDDTATGSYADPVVPLPIVGTSTVSKSKPVTVVTTSADDTATISDSESITGTGLTFSVAAPSVGGFVPHTAGGTAYVAGTHTTGPVDWSYDASDSGSVTFNKTVYVDQVRTTTGTLSDTATASGDDTGNGNSSPLSIGVSSTPLVSLTINKSIPLAYDANDGSVNFPFTVVDSNSQQVGATQHVSFDSTTGTTGHATLTGLSPGSYNVQETTTAPYLARSDQSTTISVPSCSGSVSFANDFTRATAQVQKATDPAGNEAGWTFTLTGPGIASAGLTATTTSAGAVTFNDNGSAFNLREGTYTVTETANGPYDNTAIFASRNGSQVGTNQAGSGQCNFTVDYPGDASAVYACAFTNTKHAEIVVNKTTVPSSDTTTSFPFAESGPNAFSRTFALTNGGSDSTGFTVTPGSGYSVTEGTVPVGWSQTGASCTRSGSSGSVSPSSFALGAGDVVTCSFTNTHRVALTVTKAVTANGDTVPSGGFVFDVSCSDGTVGTLTFTAAGSQNLGGIVEGSTCDVTEHAAAGWTVTPSATQHVVVGATGGSVSFTNTRDTGVITVTKTIDGAPAGASTVFTYDVVCPGHDAFDQTLTLDASSATSVTSSAIPTGFTCTVNERSTPGWQQTTPAQGGVDVSVPGTAAFANTRLTGPLQLSKAVSPASGTYTAGDPNNTLTYTLSLRPTGALDHTGVVVTDYIPGYDPANSKSGKTTYVADSATCSTNCTVSYDVVNHRLIWTVGDVAHDAAPVVMSFQVTIDEPSFDPTVGLPVERIDNGAFVESVQQQTTPSNQVTTPVTAVLGVKLVRKPPKLPFTGLQLPLGPTLTMGLSMLLLGSALTSVRRRRES